MTRQCGTCSLCCRLLPVHQGVMYSTNKNFAPHMQGSPFEFHKDAGVDCEHQRKSGSKGCCKVYGTAKMPMCCSFWNCRWLSGDDTADLRRPDRSHYVLDVVPDFITIVDNETGEKRNIQVVQVWVDPRHPDAHRDPALRAYLMRRGEEGIAALIRYDSHNAFTLFPPNMADDGQWHERGGEVVDRTHSFSEVKEALAR